MQDGLGIEIIKKEKDVLYFNAGYFKNGSLNGWGRKYRYEIVIDEKDNLPYEKVYLERGYYSNGLLDGIGIKREGYYLANVHHYLEPEIKECGFYRNDVYISFSEFKKKFPPKKGVSFFDYSSKHHKDALAYSINKYDPESLTGWAIYEKDGYLAAGNYVFGVKFYGLYFFKSPNEEIIDSFFFDEGHEKLASLVSDYPYRGGEEVSTSFSEKSKLDVYCYNEALEDMLKSSFATIGAVPPILKFEKAYYFYDDNGGLYILMKEDENNHAHEAKLFRENLKKHGFIDKGNLLHSKKYGFDVQIDGYASLLFVTFIFPDDNNDIED